MMEMGSMERKAILESQGKEVTTDANMKANTLMRVCLLE
jgi:hypothetical protein